MADIPLDILESIDRGIKDISRAMYGGKSPVRGTKPPPTTGFTPQIQQHMGMFANSVRKVAENFKSMISSTDGFLSALTRMSRNILALELFVNVLKGGIELGKQFSKLTDIGQTFGGSMFKMAQQAGESGLSLKEFADMLQKNSVATAVMNKGQGDTASAMGNLQKGVRKALESVGFYGMSLVQLTNGTSDYMETLRETGQLNHMSTQQQTKSVTDLMTNVSAFSAATGKSREEILKGVNAAMRETSAAMRMAAQGFTNEQRGAFTKIAALFSSLPGQAGEMLPKFFAQMFGTGGNAFFTEMGKTFISAGMPELNEMMGSVIHGMDANQPIEQIVHSALGMRDAILRNQDALQNLANAGVQEAAQVLALGQSMLGLDEKDLVMKYKRNQIEAELQKTMNKATVAALLFESQFHTVTGAFTTSFYRSFGKMMESFDMGSGTVKALSSTLEKVGDIFGQLLGAVFSDQNLKFITEQLQEFAKWLGDIVGDKQFVATLIFFEKTFIDVVKKIVSGTVWVLNTVHGFLGKFMSSGNAWVTMIAAWIAGKAFFSLFKTFFALNVNIIAANVSFGGALRGLVRGAASVARGGGSLALRGATSLGSVFMRGASALGGVFVRGAKLFDGALGGVFSRGAGMLRGALGGVFTRGASGLWGLLARGGSMMGGVLARGALALVGMAGPIGIALAAILATVAGAIALFKMNKSKNEEIEKFGKDQGFVPDKELSKPKSFAEWLDRQFGIEVGPGFDPMHPKASSRSWLNPKTGERLSQADMIARKQKADEAATTAPTAPVEHRPWINEETGEEETDPVVIARLERRSPSRTETLAGLTPNLTTPATPTQTTPEVKTWGDTLKSIDESFKSDFASIAQAIERQTDALAHLMIRNNKLTEEGAKPGAMDYMMMPF